MFSRSTVLVYFLLKISFTIVESLTCEEIKETKGGPASIAISILQEMTTNEVDLCLTDLGKDRLQVDQGVVLWNIFKKNYESLDEVPVEKLRTLGWISIGITVDEIRNITFDDSDIIQAFGIYHALTQNQLNALAVQFYEHSNKTPEDFTYYDLINLRQILCGFNRTDIERIHPEAYKEAAGIIGTLKDCPVDILSAFANLAMSNKAFGPIETWTVSQVLLIGNLMDGLTEVQKSMLSNDVQKALAEKSKNGLNE